MKTDIGKLTDSPGEMLKHPHTGANYYSGEQIITHLNRSLGPDGWDWIPLEHGFDADADEVWVLGQLTARIVCDALSGEGYEVRTVSKIERGWQPVNRKRSGDLISLGNDYKGADTDALKRCARLLGVGLDAWEKEAPQQKPTEIRGVPVHKPTPPAPRKANVEGCMIAWNTAVKRTRFDDAETASKYVAYYTKDAHKTLEAFFGAATEEEATAFLRSINDRVAKEAREASA